MSRGGTDPSVWPSTSGRRHAAAGEAGAANVTTAPDNGASVAGRGAGLSSCPRLPRRLRRPRHDVRTVLGTATLGVRVRSAARHGLAASGFAARCGAEVDQGEEELVEGGVDIGGPGDETSE